MKHTTKPTYSPEYWLEITPKAANKKRSIRAVPNRLDLGVATAKKWAHQLRQ